VNGDDGNTWLLYGAYGFTGRLIANLAVARGLRPVLAGRDPRRTRALAQELDLPHRVVRLEDARELANALQGVNAVLHAAGPFSATYRPMVEGCIRSGCHYLDITGEIEVLEGVFGLDDEAKRAGVVLLPGVGFDVVPTDCVAARAAARIDDPTHLDLAFLATGRPSGGTMKGMVEGLASPGRVRQGGRLTEIEHGSVTRSIPFSDGARPGVSIPWGDVSTAWYSTGVPNIRVFTPIAPGQLKWLNAARRLSRSAALRRVAHGVLGAIGGGPDGRELREGSTRVWCEVRNARGAVAVEELTTPNGYTLTADSAVVAVDTLLSPRYSGPRAGALTPSMAFGDGFVDRLEGVRRV